MPSYTTTHVVVGSVLNSPASCQDDKHDNEGDGGSDEKRAELDQLIEQALVRANIY